MAYKRLYPGNKELLKLTMLPRRLSGKESASQCRRHKFNPWVGKMLWRRKWQPTPVFLPGESHGQRNLVGYSPWSDKESDMNEHAHTKFTIKWLTLPPHPTQTARDLTISKKKKKENIQMTNSSRYATSLSGKWKSKHLSHPPEWLKPSHHDKNVEKLMIV